MPQPATHCQPWLFEARSPSTSRRRNSRAPQRPVQVQVLDQEATRRSCGPGCAPSPPPAAAASRRRRSGSRCAPRPRPRTGPWSGSSGSAANARVEALAGRARLVPQHVGIELAPGQLLAERLRSLPGAPDRSASSVRGCTVPYFRCTDSRLVPGRSGRSRWSAYVGQRRRRGTRPTGRSAAASPASGSAQAGRQVGVRGHAGRVDPGQPRHRARRRRAGRAPAVPQPGPVERRVHPERRAVVLAHPPRRDRVRRAGPDQRHPVRSAASTRSSRSRPYGPKSAATCTDDASTSSATRGTTLSGRPAARPAARRAPRRARAGAVEERQPGSPARPAQRVVEHEQWQHPVAGGVAGREQGRVVPEPQVPPEPQHAGHSGDRTAGASRSPVEGTQLPAWYVPRHMVTVRFRALSALAVAGAALLLAACGNATVQPGSGSTDRRDRRLRRAAPPRARPRRTRSPCPSPPAAAFQPGPTGIPVGSPKAVTIDGVIEAGVEPGCKVLTAGNTKFLILGGNDVPMGVPVRVEGDAPARGFEHLPAGDAAASD